MKVIDKKIVAIGGGEIGREGYDIETLEIDREIIKLTNKKIPTLLFVPTASEDSEGYCETIYNYYGKKLKCNIEYLKLIKDKLSFAEIKRKINSADIIYVGGGNTLKMMTIWRNLGVDTLLI